MQISTPWRWLAFVCLITLLAAALTWPMPMRFSALVLGTPCNDLFDEINIHTTVTRNLLAGKSLFYSDNLDYPINRNLLITHKSFLHILFAAPLIACLPWPLWWNISVLAALITGTWAASYTLVRLERSWMYGLLLGCTFMGWQWLRDIVAWGHLVQLWTAPLYLAILCLVLCLRENSRTRYFWGLGCFTLITAFIYWIWGLCLAVLGALALAYYWPSLSKAQLKRLAITVAGAALIALPAAYYVLSLNPNLPKLRSGGAISAPMRQQALERASSNAILRTTSDARKTLPGAGAIPLLAALLPFALLICACKKRWESLFWSSAALLFFVIGCGPYLQYSSFVFTDSSGTPIRLPYYYIAEWTGLGYRWQTLSTVYPIMMLCLCLAAIQTLKKCQRRPSPAILTGAIALSGTIVFLTIQGAQGAGLGNAQRSLVPSPAAQPLNAFFPSFSFRKPPFLAALRSLPPGALLELPLGYTGNVWQLQHLHGQRTCHGRCPVPSIMEKNSFVLWLYRYSGWTCQDLGMQLIPDLKSAELPYGTETVPEHLRSPSNRYPAISRELSRQGAVSDYKVMRSELQVLYAVVHRANCAWLSPQEPDKAFERINEMMAGLCGAALYRDSDVAVFAWPSVDSMQSLWDTLPWQETLPIPLEDSCSAPPSLHQVPE